MLELLLQSIFRLVDWFTTRRQREADRRDRMLAEVARVNAWLRTQGARWTPEAGHNRSLDV